MKPNFLFIYKYYNYKERHAGMLNYMRDIVRLLSKNSNINIICHRRSNTEQLDFISSVSSPFIINAAIKANKEKNRVIFVFTTLNNSIIGFLYYFIIRLFNWNKKIVLYQGSHLTYKIFSVLYLNLFDKVFCISDNVYNDVKNVIGDRAVHLPSGVDFKEIAKVKSVKKNKKIRIGFFGHLMWHKGSDNLARAFIRSNQKDAELIIAGTGPLYSKLNELSKNHKNIIIYPYLKDVRAYIKSCDIVIFPFRVSDMILGLSLGGIEAKAMGKTLIGTNTPAISQLIDHGEDGFIVKNEKDLSNKISLLCNNPSLLKKMGVKSKINSKKYDINKTIRTFLGEYHKLIK